MKLWVTIFQGVMVSVFLACSNIPTFSLEYWILFLGANVLILTLRFEAQHESVDAKNRGDKTKMMLGVKMIFYKYWDKPIDKHKTGIGCEYWRYDGWFLFGVIPVYIRRQSQYIKS